MRSSIRKSLTSAAEELCGSAAKNEFSSAYEVLDFYCSAADDLVSPYVTESIAQTWPTGYLESRTAKSPHPSETGSSSDSSNSSKETESNQSGGNGSSSRGGGSKRTAAIVGSVLGGAAVILLLIGTAFFIYRKKRNAKAGVDVISEPPGSRCTPELHGNTAGAASNKDVHDQQLFEMPHKERPSELNGQSESGKIPPFHQPFELDNTGPGSEATAKH